MVANNTIQALDSLCANEYAFEIDGEATDGVFRISNFVSFMLDEDGKRVYEPFEVAKMVQRDADNIFNQWLRESISANGDSPPKRTVAIVAMDDGIETRRWTVKGAWINSVRYTDFNSASFEMIEEIFTIHYDEIEETWPAI